MDAPDLTNIDDTESTAYHRYEKFMRDNMSNGGRCSCGVLFEIHVPETDIVEDLERSGFTPEEWGDNPHQLYYEHILKILKEQKNGDGVLTNCCLGNTQVPIFFTCPKCENLSEKQKRQAFEKHRIVNLIKTLKHNCVVSEDMLLETFENAKPEYIWEENQHAWDTMNAWELSEGNVLIEGNKGTGKTYLCRSVLNKFLEMGYYVGDLYAMRLSEMGTSFHMQQEIHPFCKAKLLLIDDIDKMNAKRGGIEALSYLLEYRSHRKLRTLMTSNLPFSLPDTEENKYKPTVYKRFLEAAPSEFVSAMVDRLSFVGHEKIKIIMTGKSIRRET